MIAYFAVGAASTAISMLKGANALVSLANIPRWCSMGQLARLRTACDKLFLDSGAFTAWKSGRPIVLQTYIDFVREHHATFDTIAALDDITDCKASVANWNAITDALPDIRHKLVPVYHENEPWDVLEIYLASASYIGIGRTEARGDKTATLSLYDSVFNRYPEIVAHAFGCSDPTMLEPYPFASFDSTSWERNATYSNKFGYPWNRCSKELRMRAYIEATRTIEHRPHKQQQLPF